jgi:RNA polymerase sigma-70 factor (ECF subfamily)
MLRFHDETNGRCQRKRVPVVDQTLGARCSIADPLSLQLQRWMTMPRSQDRESEFEQFFIAQYDSIAQSVAFVCGDAERAKDATQEAFIKAYARWGKVRRYDNVGAWVRRIAINASRDAHRSEVRRSRREERAAPPQSEWDADPDTSTLELLEHLPERQRAIAALYYLDDMTVAEISDVLSIAEGTVRFHLSQARGRLRDHLDRSQHRAH